MEEEGVLLLKRGDRLNLQFKEGPRLPEDVEFEHADLSDGVNLDMSVSPSKTGEPKVHRMETPQGLGAWMAAGLARVGVYASRGACLESSGDHKGSDPRTMYSLSGFREEKPDSPGVRGVSYVVALDPGMSLYAVTLFFDPQTYAPVRLILRRPRVKDGNHVFTETYQEFSRDVELPDDAFKLPAGK